MVSLTTPVCDFDAPAIDFSLPGVDNQNWTLEKAKGENGLFAIPLTKKLHMLFLKKYLKWSNKTERFFRW
ncbi:hypothetical protein [Thiomicrorhabdus heinhorstiae]|uniref:hypothetical protein n=1 Tax=Thiomicrorhabdus heinhorstiae TaxID=2748010 RepID=UPI002B4B4B0B|nr:hypothetical protein [Thiomicrorhabdus heinhorstiae]